jgi:hypothetical protein
VNRESIDIPAGLRQSGSSGSCRTTADTQQNGAGFVIPESVCQLRFDELPITTRLVNVLRSIGAQTLGDLQGCTPFELLQYKDCGWRTVGEIEQLITRKS